MTPEELQPLIEKYLAGKASKEEMEQLQEWYMQGTEGEVQLQLDAIHKNENEALLQSSLYKKIQKEISSQQAPVRQMPWLRWAAAASIILVTGYVLWISVGNKSQQTADKTVIAKPLDIPAPQNTRAVITLANGNKVYLDSAGNGILAQEDNVNVVRNENGEIEYQALTTHQSPLTFNTLYNPRGSKVISLTLSDGTKVWLNSESALKYPTAFNGNTREVEITGEAYFEVAKTATKQSFIVRKDDVSVTVLGTHFNVNAYKDEDALRVTLLEGSVRVAQQTANSNQRTATLKPGEQVSANGQLSTVVRPDLEEVMAWKNGRFQFGDGTDIKQIMKQLERWYDVNVAYKGDVKGEIGGGISRAVNLSQVLNMLEMTGTIKFDIQEKQITVSQ